MTQPNLGAYRKKLQAGCLQLSVIFEHYFKHTTLVLLTCLDISGEKMHTLTRTATTEMEVTSIRLEKELKDRLKELAGNQGYQALIRDILWKYVQQKSSDYVHSPADIRASIAATAQKEEHCVITGQSIQPQEPMLLGLTTYGDLVPISMKSLPM